MLEPSYLYAHGLADYRDELLANVAHTPRVFNKGDVIWKLGEYIDWVYYIDSGVVKTSVFHEDGYSKTLYFCGRDSVYPGCHESQFNIEKSLVSVAVTTVQAQRFRRSDFYAYAKRPPICWLTFSNCMPPGLTFIFMNLLIRNTTVRSGDCATLSILLMSALVLLVRVSN